MLIICRKTKKVTSSNVEHGVSAFAFTITDKCSEGVHVTIGNPASYIILSLFLHLTGVQFRGELHHGVDFSQQKIKCRPIRTREIGGVSLSEVLYVLQCLI